MIIQNTPHIIQANQPGSHASGVATVQSVADIPAQNNAPQPTIAELKRAVSTINQGMQQANLDLQFSIDTDSQRTVVKMVDTSTGELIRQYPTKATLAISLGIEQFQQGLLVKREA